MGAYQTSEPALIIVNLQATLRRAPSTSAPFWRRSPPARARPSTSAAPTRPTLRTRLGWRTLTRECRRATEVGHVLLLMHACAGRTSTTSLQRTRASGMQPSPAAARAASPTARLSNPSALRTAPRSVATTRSGTLRRLGGCRAASPSATSSPTSSLSTSNRRSRAWGQSHCILTPCRRF
jgi:hypothetical protein